MLSDAKPQISPIHRMAQLAHELLGCRIAAGDYVMDATMGNGYDTLFLWKKVEPGGKVFAFDIQPSAISSTKILLKSNGWHETSPGIELILDSHSQFAQYVDKPLKAVMFNLGYLPGSYRHISTSWPEVNNVMEQLTNSHLAIGGFISIISYSGHDEGRVEQQQLLEYVRKLPSKSWSVLEMIRSNTDKSTPKLILIERKA